MDLNKLQRKVDLAKASVKRNKANLKGIDKDSPKYDTCKRSIKAAQTRLNNAKAELAEAKPKSKVVSCVQAGWEKIPFKRTFGKVVTKTGLIVVGTVTLIGGAIIYDKMKDTPMDDGEPVVDQV
jgi:hypothetical protein